MKDQAADAVLWVFAHAPLTFCLLAAWVGGFALLARFLGRRIE